MNSKIPENPSSSPDQVDGKHAPDNAKVPMTSQELFDRWLELAQYDLDTADAMYNTGRWLYTSLLLVNKQLKNLSKVWNRSQNSDLARAALR
jgi:hypothetical protein